MNQKTYLLIAFSQTAFSGIVAMIALLNFSKRSHFTILIGSILLMAFVTQVAAYFLTFVHLTNLPVYLYNFGLLILLSLFYNYATGKRYTLLFIIITGIYITFAIANLTYFRRDVVASYTTVLGSFIIMFYAFFYFYSLLSERPVLHITRFPMFWFNTAFLVYYGGSFFLFALASDRLNVFSVSLYQFWNFVNLSFIIHNLIILVGLYYEFKLLRRQPNNAN